MKIPRQPTTLLDRLLERYPNAKRQTLKRMVQNRRVRINGNVATKLNQPIDASDKIEVASIEPRQQSDLGFPIIFEDRDLLVIDKPPGLLTSTVPREPRPTALAALREYLAQRDPAAKLGLIHRLDRDASGLLVFSKNSKAFESLKAQFARHSVERIYHAMVSPPLKKPLDRIESRLLERADGTVRSTHVHAQGQRAITEYSTLKVKGKIATLRVKLFTGRKHQIRVHLSEAGSPVVGDTVYGGLPHDAGLMLKAVELHLDHPRSGKRMSFTIPSLDYSPVK